MQIVVADTGPINYLVLVGHIDVLPALFERVILPVAVRDELGRPGAPPVVQRWITSLPGWAEVRQSARSVPAESSVLDVGEEEAIELAIEIDADMILMDDREGVALARRNGIEVSLREDQAHQLPLPSGDYGTTPHRDFGFPVAGFETGEDCGSDACITRR